LDEQETNFPSVQRAIWSTLFQYHTSPCMGWRGGNKRIKDDMKEGRFHSSARCAIWSTRSNITRARAWMNWREQTHQEWHEGRQISFISTVCNLIHAFPISHKPVHGWIGGNKHIKNDMKEGRFHSSARCAIWSTLFQYHTSPCMDELEETNASRRTWKKGRFHGSQPVKI
jgi:hypothetical protein